MFFLRRDLSAGMVVIKVNLQSRHCFSLQLGLGIVCLLINNNSDIGRLISMKHLLGIIL